MTDIDFEDVSEERELALIEEAVKKPGFEAMRRQIHELFYDEHALANRLIARMAARISKYPPRDFCGQAKWSEDLVDARVQAVWKTVLNPAMSYFAKLAKAPPHEVASIIWGQIRKVMIAEATPTFKKFYNLFIQQLHHDQPLNRFASKKVAKQRFRGLRAWKNDIKIKLGNKKVEELVKFWQVEKRLRFPNMACGENLIGEPLRDRVWEMFKLLNEWVLEKYFFRSWKKLVNFPTAVQAEQSLDGLPRDSESGPEAVEKYLDHNGRDLLGIEQLQAVNEVLCENADSWNSHFDRVFAILRPEQKKFLQYYYINRLAAGAAAEKVGKAPSFATQTFNRVAEECISLREQLSSEELPALSEFLKVYLLNLQPETGRTKK
ncbi:MAG TPA: hypothetical protein PLM07_19525 [Candidatus Rifleibacterium sp.]|nr:hypothetical protein [Candidatus Rifleibacterium sp.]HPT48079.1 hypothetical protein [Candidatus Rifleibacterium sp.]